MRTSYSGLLAVLLSVLPAAALAKAAPPAEPVAVIAAVKGRVEVAHARGDAGPATFGRALEHGDRVTVGKGGAATLFFGDGGVLTLGERSTFTVGGRAAAPAPAAALPGEVFAQVSQFATAGSRETGLVAMTEMRSDADANAPLLLSPRNTAVLDDAPVLRWRSFAGATTYRVRCGVAGGAELWTREVPASPGAEQSLAFPAGSPLAPGSEYEWEVEARDGERTVRAESATLRLLPAAPAAEARANLARIAASAGSEAAPAARFLAGSYLAGLGLLDDAARQFRELAALAPGAPEPHEALGALYLKVGLADRAAAEFQQALVLQREAR